MRIRAPRFFERFRLYRCWVDLRGRHKVARWDKRGRPVPPPGAFKQQTLREYGKKYGVRTLLETGTLHGDTLFRLLGDFDALYSIELSEELHAKAQKRFRPFPHVHLIQGDSGAKMKEVLPRLAGPTLFWLDGHYSAGETAQGDLNTPIFMELETIFSRSPFDHVILIDDARDFGGVDSHYPTLDRLQAFIAEKGGPKWRFEVADDIIRVTPDA
ncbi:hypothetical protein SAMN05444156_1984 [Verrucomicrobium sp. GAS474]|uniref:hypothetical protein n=1 Tax=Verrucomicrobium sp. GAS474 TaxID=1882831 RepID=UPI00087B7590|nr:hypothetical protein [Verrucomicrobium sp. GAS474]SDU10543.1 hypothetical protein SAMN05444156_1984 [Verrucomicrobium sp. GAS474]